MRRTKLIYKIRGTLPILLVIGLLTSFWYNTGWLQLCAGLALFLFGMQCLEDGLRELAGSRLERWLAASTETRFKGFLFGVGGTMVLQSTTLMSLLTIAFISTGLIQMSGGIAINLGMKLGASFGVWLLAWAGYGFNLTALAMPLLVLGVLAGFNGEKSKAVGRIVLGIAFIFIGIEYIKLGFNGFDDSLNLTGYGNEDFTTIMFFVMAGFLLTAVLQSSHATLMLAFTAMAASQLELWQAMAIAIGANVGSSVTTAIVGWIGGSGSGRRLAIMHVIFNLVTAVVALVLIWPLKWLSIYSLSLVGNNDNLLFQLAMFQTIFNLIVIIMFWPFQQQIERFMLWMLPEKNEPEILITEEHNKALLLEQYEQPQSHARYLNEEALTSASTAVQAVLQEIKHLRRLSFEVICHALYQPVQQIKDEQVDEKLLLQYPTEHGLDADELYQRHIKGVYSELLEFMSHLEVAMDETQQQFWISCQVVALQLVEAVKESGWLQDSLAKHLINQQNPIVTDHYLELRCAIIMLMRTVRKIAAKKTGKKERRVLVRELEQQINSFEQDFQQKIFNEIKAQRLTATVASSLINDYGYYQRFATILRSMLEVATTNRKKLFESAEELQQERLEKLRAKGGI